MQPLSTSTFSGYDGRRSALEIGANRCAYGSKNLIFPGNGKGIAYKGPSLQVGVNGSRAMFNSPDGGYVGLGNATTSGIGSAIGLIANAMGIIGAGQVFINGLTRSISASTAGREPRRFSRFLPLRQRVSTRANISYNNVTIKIFGNLIAVK